MSLKASLIRTAINMTPEWIVRWVTNFVLKEIAELKFFHFDLDSRKLYVEVQLVGESETIQVWVENFYVTTERAVSTVVIEQARSNRLWLTNILGRIVGRAWKVPVPDRFSAYADLLTELLQPKLPAP